MQVTFDPENHGYAIDGRPVPGIHEIGEALGLIPESKHMPDEARRRGQYVHEAIELDLHDNLKETSCPALLGYVRAARKFLADHKIQVMKDGVEVLVGNPGLAYATQVDFLGVQSMEKDETLDINGNWKTGAPEAFHDLQAAAERLCLPGGVWYSVNVYLQPDGNYTPIWTADPRDEELWRNACNLYDWLCRRHQSVRPRGVSKIEQEKISEPIADSVLFDDGPTEVPESWLKGKIEGESK
jgi:hypothetical protein